MSGPGSAKVYVPWIIRDVSNWETYLSDQLAVAATVLIPINFCREQTFSVYVRTFPSLSFYIS